MASGTGVQRFTVALHKHHGTDHPARLQRPVDDRVDARGEFVIGTNRRQLKRNRVTFRPRLVDADGRTVRFADESTRDVGVVIWATGYRSDYSWIHIPDLIEDRRVTHRRGVTNVPGLYFLGLSWQHTRGSALLGFVNDDAAHLAHQITTHRHPVAPLSG